jgi:hypothetical protein
MQWNIYLSGEIHTDWRQKIMEGCTEHDEELIHALKEVDGPALGWATTPEQVVEILDYVTTKE